MPINSWEKDIGSNLQIVSFADDKLKDVGLLPLPTEVQRSLMLDSNVLAGLGNQSLVTLQWGVDKKPEILAELELAINLAWLKLQDGDLWSAAMGNQGYYRFYRYETGDLEVPAQSWSLAKSYNNVIMDEEMAVFYNYYEPFEAQIFTKNTEKLSPPIKLMTEKQQRRAPPVNDLIWYDRSSPFLQNGWFYMAEQQPFKPGPNMILPIPEQDYWQSQYQMAALQCIQPLPRRFRCPFHRTCQTESHRRLRR